MFIRPRLVALALGALYLTAAQDLGVPLAWRVRFPSFTHVCSLYISSKIAFLSQKFSNNRPLSERISISVDAINTIIPQLNFDAQFNGK
jgi:hypothetical protein